MTALTGVFKLHNPSQKKRKTLDYCFEQYTLAIKDMLSVGKEYEDLLRDWGRVVKKSKNDLTITDKYSADSIMSLLPPNRSIKQNIGGSLKDSIKTDIARMLASYLSGEDTTGYPAVFNPNFESLGDVLFNFSLVGPDLEDYNTSRDSLTKKLKNNYYPILFCRSSDIKMLYDIKNNRFFIYLASVKVADNDFDTNVIIDQGNLIDINTGEIFKNRSKTALLCPIELGRKNDEWQWQYKRFIKPTLDGLSSIKEGHLVKKGNDYFVNLSFVFNDVETYPIKSYLGIDRGIIFTMAYSIVDLEGKVLYRHSEKDGYRDEQIKLGITRQKRQKKGLKTNFKHFKRQEQEAILHRLINRIIDKAIEYQSAIVLEKLNIQVKGKWIKSAFAKIERFLKYKCELAGVPFYGTVFAAKSSMICIHCGNLVERKKEDYQRVYCPYCDTWEHSDEAAAVNIARRAMYRKAEWKGGYREFHKSFSQIASQEETKSDLRTMIDAFVYQ